MDTQDVQVISFIIERDLYSKVRKHCYATGTKIKWFAADALREKLSGKSNAVKKFKSSAK